MESWGNFFVAEIGASAALAGLIFVGVSINLTKIMTYRGLTNRALEPLVVLLIVLLVSSLQLVPGQSPALAGGETLLVGLAGWATLLKIHLDHLRFAGREHRTQAISETIISQTGGLAFLVAGLAMLTRGQGGVYWIVPGVIISFLVVFFNAWVLLIEINR